MHFELFQPKPETGKCERPDEGGLKDSDEFPIGDIRRRLFIQGSDPWNATVRDVTAELEMKWGERKHKTPPPSEKCCEKHNYAEGFCVKRDSPAPETPEFDPVEHEINYLARVYADARTNADRIFSYKTESQMDENEKYYRESFERALRSLCRKALAGKRER
jgi:hypothetical protein